MLALALAVGQRTDMGGSNEFNIVWGAIWAFVFVWSVGLRALPFRDSLLWGTAYGFLGWLIGPVTLNGVLSGHGVLWSVADFSEQFPDLIAYLFYGISLGVMYAVVYRLVLLRQPVKLVSGTRLAVIRGALAGLLVGLIFINRLPFLGLLPVPGMHPESTPRLIYLLLSIIVGAASGVVTLQSHEQSGISLIRGMVYGMAWWVVIVLTIQPLISGQPVAWKLSAAQNTISNLLGLIVYGGILALFYHLITQLQQALFADEVGIEAQEGIGVRNLRAIGWGVAGSILGGLAFTVIMVQVGDLPVIAGIVRGGDAATGLIVHFIISIIIGAMYGALFSRVATSYGSAIGWGTAYGLFWWILGRITLLPLLLGQEGTLSRAAAVNAYPASFIGHVAYGAITAMYFYFLERRRKAQNTVSNSIDEAEQATVSETAQTPIWLMIVMFIGIVPILLH